MLVSLMSSAPDIFVPVALDESSAFYAPVVVLGIAIVMAGVFSYPEGGDSHPRLRQARAVIVMVLGGLLIPGGIVATIEGGDTARDAVTAAEVGHAQLVVDWLADDYGIDADTDSATALVAGESLAADYDGGRVVISLAKTTTGTYTVVDEHQTLLPLLAP